MEGYTFNITSNKIYDVKKGLVFSCHPRDMNVQPPISR